MWLDCDSMLGKIGTGGRDLLDYRQFVGHVWMKKFCQDTELKWQDVIVQIHNPRIGRLTDRHNAHTILYWTIFGGPGFPPENKSS